MRLTKRDIKLLLATFGTAVISNFLIKLLNGDDLLWSVLLGLLVGAMLWTILCLVFGYLTYLFALFVSKTESLFHEEQEMADAPKLLTNSRTIRFAFIWMVAIQVIQLGTVLFLLAVK